MQLKRWLQHPPVGAVMFCSDGMLQWCSVPSFRFVLSTSPTTAILCTAGEAVTFFTEEDSGQLRSIANVIVASGGEVPAWMVTLHKAPKHRNRRDKGVDVLGQGEDDDLEGADADMTRANGVGDGLPSTSGGQEPEPAQNKQRAVKARQPGSQGAVASLAKHGGKVKAMQGGMLRDSSGKGKRSHDGAARKSERRSVDGGQGSKKRKGM